MTSEQFCIDAFVTVVWHQRGILGEVGSFLLERSPKIL